MQYTHKNALTTSNEKKFLNHTHNALKSSTKKAKTLLQKATQLYISERGMHTNT
jgi:hypothetical protein